jgi:hypothetical protein
MGRIVLDTQPGLDDLAATSKPNLPTARMRRDVADGAKVGSNHSRLGRNQGIFPGIVKLGRVALQILIRPEKRPYERNPLPYPSIYPSRITDYS